MIKTIDAVYDEKENEYVTICPFCGDRVGLKYADDRYRCEHFILWYTDDEIDAPNWELPKGMLYYLGEHPSVVHTKWHKAFYKWYI